MEKKSFIKSDKERAKEYRDKNKEKIAKAVKLRKLKNKVVESEKEKGERNQKEAEQKKLKREGKKPKPGTTLRATPLDQAGRLPSITTSLAGREEQFGEVLAWVEGRLVEGRGGTMYLWGAPGTGKTSTVREVSGTQDTRHATFCTSLSKYDTPAPSIFSQQKLYSQNANVLC